MLPRAQKRFARTTLWVGILVGLILAGCTGSGVQMVYLHFRPTGEISSFQASTVAVSPFQDMRSAPQIIGKRIRVDGSPETIMLGSPNTGKDLTYIVTRYLEAKGMKVVDLPSWRPEPESLKDLPPGVRLAVTGKIESLDVQADSNLFRTLVRYRIRLTGYLGLPDRGEVLTRSVEISPQRTTATFDVRQIEEDLNGAIMEAIGRLFEGVLSQI
jgi:hypothetical protein